MNLFFTRRAASLFAVLALAVMATACGESSELTQQRQLAQDYKAQLDAANRELTQLKAATPTKSAEPPPPSPPPPPAMPHWQVVRYAPNGSVVKVVPTFYWSVSGSCVYFTQREKQQSQSVICGGQFDVLEYEPK